MEKPGKSTPTEEQFDQSQDAVVESTSIPTTEEPVKKVIRKPRVAKSSVEANVTAEVSAIVEAVESHALEQLRAETTTETIVEAATETVAKTVTTPEIAPVVAETNEPKEVKESSFTSVLEGKSKVELVEYLAKIIQEHSIGQLKGEIEILKVAFYKLHNLELEAAKAQFYAQNPEDAKFEADEDKSEYRLKELLTLYRGKRDQFTAASEAEKEANYKSKLAIIEQLKELTNSNETLHNTFEAFRELQGKWKDIGLVPQSVARDLWDTYNHHIEIFYNYIKINKELRDLDLKRNYEAKLALCEQAEALVLDASAVNAFHKLQKLHEQWAQVGPVAIEFKETLWERFKNASTLVNKRHQEHFDVIKGEQESNLVIKSGLCDQVEALADGEYGNKSEWDSASDKVIELQKIWKSVGFAPKKDNNKIYERFRAGCDKFFGAKREYFDGLKGQLNDNYQAKLDLCVQAEALSESTQWKQTTEEILALQKRWKETGPTSRRHSEAVWGRFRAACDKFFSAKGKHFESNDAQYAKNLEEKQALIVELEGIDVSSITFDQLKEFQRRWSSIGFVPMKFKEELSSKYKRLIDDLFDSLRGNESARRMDHFKGRVAGMRDSGRAVGGERERLANKVKSLEGEIATLENNIGFFGRSKGAEALIKEVQNKIDRAKAEIVEIIEKVKIIDNQ